MIERVVEAQEIVEDGAETYWEHFFSFAADRLAWLKVIQRPNGIPRAYRFFVTLGGYTIYRSRERLMLCDHRGDRVEVTPKPDVRMDTIARQMPDYYARNFKPPMEPSS